MLVAVGTKNPVKVQGVKKVFVEFFRDAEVREVDTSPITKPQPIGIDQIITGAMERAEYCLTHANADFGVGVEAGIFPLGIHSSYLNQQYAVILDRNASFSVGSSLGFMLPSSLVDKLLSEGRELEHYATELTGVKNIGDKEGFVYHLTRGTVSRVALVEQCVRAALVPWLNKSLYKL